MPQLLWLYLTALLYYRTSVSCVALAEALEAVSHDRLTRLLQANWSGQTLLELAVRTLFVWERGYLIIDDTVLPKPFATAIEGLAWVFSSQERKPVYGWYFVCRLKKNRRFNGQAVRHHRRHPYWAEIGWLSGGLKVLVVRHGKKYYATNRLTLSAVEVRQLYRMRTQIEELIRVCKDQLGLTGCQARSERAQARHITCCLVAFCVLERERQDRRLSIYKLRRQLCCKGRSYALPALERLKRAA